MRHKVNIQYDEVLFVNQLNFGLERSSTENATCAI